MKNTIRIVILVIAMGCLILGYYYYLSHRNTTTEDNEATTETTELQKVLEKDFSTEYPETPRSVVKWYNRIISLYYEETTKDEQVDSLCDQAMMLMDADLLQYNPRDTYIASVKADIQDYKNREKKIVTIEVCSTSDVEYKDRDDGDYAYVLVYYFIKEGSNFQKTYQKFALRKDDGGKWKIIAMQLTDADGNALPTAN
ncbi:MAG: hypothetical protein K5675_03140 [Lachnospiraceae bacterium]|nr:hypothetical protein [Lachnospiraceae bacterium]